MGESHEGVAFGSYVLFLKILVKEKYIYCAWYSPTLMLDDEKTNNNKET